MNLLDVARDQVARSASGADSEVVLGLARHLHLVGGWEDIDRTLTVPGDTVALEIIEARVPLVG
jgi:hypothetical protein